MGRPKKEIEQVENVGNENQVSPENSEDFKEPEVLESPKEIEQVENVGKNNKKHIPDEVRECVGKIILINDATNQASIISEYYADVILENAVATHGSKKVRIFNCTEDNLEELVVIFNKYQNGILKK